jgi:type IV pilus assembly protein PilX
MKHNFPGNERGAVLIVSLIFLVILTMLGVTAMSSTTFEERMAGNARDASLAHHAAEAAIREARDEALDLKTAPKSRHLFMSDFGLDTLNNTGNCARGGICQPRLIELADPAVNKPVTLPEIPANVIWTEGDSVTNGITARYGEWTNSPALSGLSKRPRYIVELFCPPLAYEGPGAAGQCRLYRFTAVGWGKNPNTQVTLQETYLAEKER